MTVNECWTRLGDVREGVIWAFCLLTARDATWCDVGLFLCSLQFWGRAPGCLVAGYSLCNAHGMVGYERNGPGVVHICEGHWWFVCTVHYLACMFGTCWAKCKASGLHELID